VTAPLKATDAQIVAAYSEHGSVWRAATALGMCGQSVHERLVKLGAITPMNIFSDAEKAVLVAQYEEAANNGQLAELAKAMCRTKPFICRQARALGLTNKRRTKKYLSEVASAAAKAWHQAHEHPRGMLGKKHSDATREAMSRFQTARWEQMTDDEQSALIIKQIKAKIAKGAPQNIGNRESASWKAGWREVGGQRVYFRSRWEANYARYLQALVDDGKILSWEHEPQTFWFDGIKRGSMSYLPDFRVKHTDGSITYHEVKGWMDDRSRTKLARMAKYYPEVALIVIAKDEYRRLSRLLAYVIDGWES
jgi:hypothetical protein